MLLMTNRLSSASVQINLLLIHPPPLNPPANNKNSSRRDPIRSYTIRATHTLIRRNVLRNINPRKLPRRRRFKPPILQGHPSPPHRNIRRNAILLATRYRTVRQSRQQARKMLRNRNHTIPTNRMLRHLRRRMVRVTNSNKQARTRSFTFRDARVLRFTRRRIRPFISLHNHHSPHRYPRQVRH